MIQSATWLTGERLREAGRGGRGQRDGGAGRPKKGWSARRGAAQGVELVSFMQAFHLDASRCTDCTELVYRPRSCKVRMKGDCPSQLDEVVPVALGQDDPATRDARVITAFKSNMLHRRKG